MITEFGKALRKLRIDRGEILKTMAEKLNMTSSYLSAIECGKRNIPSDLISKLASIYDLTEEEQEILSRYVGWGGLKSAFEEQNENWTNEYIELKGILTEDEYKNARASSVTAYYTPPVVIRNIYKALQNMGLKQANILEPACRGR